jgi:membrane associated rhomboid family serine protease
MFFFLPWGHDRPTYDRPWATYALVAACVLVHLALWPSSQRAEQEVESAALEIEDALARDPDARISFTVTGLPRTLDEIVQPMIDTSGRRAGDPELEGGVRRLVAALNGMPAFRFGWRSGAPAPWRAITSMFVHADVFHLFGNMVLLWVAGGLIEVFWNRWAFVALYLLSGVAGVLAQHLSAPSSLAPLIGASGAIAGLLGALVVGYPNARIKIFYFFLFFWRPVWGNWLAPAWFVIPLWAGFQVLSMFLFQGEGGVAYAAHVGGFVMGALFAVIAKRLNWIALDAGHEVVHGDGYVEVTRQTRRSVAPTTSTPLGMVVPGERRASARPPAPHAGQADALEQVVPGERRRSTRPPPTSEPLELAIPGERRLSVRPPPGGAVRPSERPPRSLASQPPPRSHALRDPHAISLDELPPATPGEEIER